MNWAGTSTFDHEDGNGQFETDFAYTNVVSMADRLVFFRMMVGEIARKHGLFGSADAENHQPTALEAAPLQHVATDAAGTNLFAAEGDPRGDRRRRLPVRRPACGTRMPSAPSSRRLPNSHVGSSTGQYVGLRAPVFACYGDNNLTCCASRAWSSRMPCRGQCRQSLASAARSYWRPDWKASARTSIQVSRNWDNLYWLSA